MKIRLQYGCLALLLWLGSMGCKPLLPVDSSAYIGADAETAEPVAVATLVTPEPTAAPKTFDYAMEGTFFRRDGVSAALKGVSYVEGKGVELNVALENQTDQPLTLACTAPGALNGWALTYALRDAAGDTFTIAPQSADTVLFIAALDEKTALRMALDDVASVGMTFSGTLGERAFVPATNVLPNPACKPGYAQSYGTDGGLLFENALLRCYDCGLDPVTATRYVSLESLAGPLDITAVPCVNGYALGDAGAAAATSAQGAYAMLAVPLLPTLTASAHNAAETLTLSLVVSQKGKQTGAVTFAVPCNDGPAPDLGAQTPAYAGSGRTFFRNENDAIHIYYEGLSTEKSDYYGRITRLHLVCINDTDAVLVPQAELVKLAGAVMDGGFAGFLPPRSLTRFDLSVCANVPAGSTVLVELQLLDAAARLRRVAGEEISFAS